MERIQEIEQRLNSLSKRGLEGYSAKEDFHVNAETDIEYLLAKNKRLRDEIKSRNYTNAQYVACLQEKEIIRSQYIDFLKQNIEELHQKPFDEDVAYRLDFLNRELEQALREEK